MDIKNITVSLSEKIREKVFPKLGKAVSREAIGTGASGDTTFQIDEIAENVVKDFLQPFSDIAYYTEDVGLVINGQPEIMMIIDPIDGTRPAAAGFESACISIAVCSYSIDPVIGDLFLGVVQEIKTGNIFIAEKDKGIEIKNGPINIKLSQNDDLKTLFWTLGFRGRPSKVIVDFLGELIDISSVDGGVFDLGSASYAMTRLVTGQLDAYLDVGKRLIDEFPELKEDFLKTGYGKVLNNNPYDIAGSYLILKEAGAQVTDAYGQPLDNYKLIGSGEEFQISTIASSNSSIQKKLFNYIENSIKEYRLNK